MNILAIDTSTKNLSLAVSKDDKVIKFSNAKLHRPLSSSIIPRINRILNSAGVSLANVDGFAVGLGPGSFTGLRVGLSTVKGLAFALRKPIVGISSLDVLALNVKEDHPQICTMCDAKRNLVYACVFDKKGLQLTRKLDYTLDNAAAVLKEIKGDVLFIGDGIDLYRQDILRAKGIKPQFAKMQAIIPQAKNLAQLAINQFQNGQYADINKLAPLYLYPEHCQIRK